MPIVSFTEAELRALYDVLTTAAKVDWAAYEEAKARILEAGRRQRTLRHIIDRACDQALLSHEW